MTNQKKIPENNYRIPHIVEVCSTLFPDYDILSFLQDVRQDNIQNMVDSDSILEAVQKVFEEADMDRQYKGDLESFLKKVRGKLLSDDQRRLRIPAQFGRWFFNGQSYLKDYLNYEKIRENGSRKRIVKIEWIASLSKDENSPGVENQAI
jgi:hypothetical protein